MIITPQMQASIPFQYVNDVLNGTIITGDYIKLAVNRFLTWIKTADADGYYLDHKEGMFVINFFPTFLQHTKGPLAKNREPFTLSPYQQFTIYNIFAWKYTESGLRRINLVYESVARKNGKTTLLAGIGLYCQSLDGEQGPEIYVGATKELQAKVLWEQATDFVIKSLKLRTLGFKNTQREIRFGGTSGAFRFLGGDSKTLDGLNPSVAFIDEYHAHKDDTVREVLSSAMGARDNPLMYIITTAGFNLKSACKIAEDGYKDILKGLNEDNHILIMIHQMDELDDWENEDNWQKCNPNLIYSSTLLNFTKRAFLESQNAPSKIPNFKTKSLNMWVDGANVWISSELWKACDLNKGLSISAKNRVQVPVDKFYQNGSFAAVDLSTNTDMTAFVIVSEPDENGDRFVKPFLFCPEDTIDKRSKEDKVPYRLWRDLGYLIATPGNVVDYDVLLDYVRDNWHKYGIKRVEFDRWNSTSMTSTLIKEGFEVSMFSQTVTNYSHPTKVFEQLVLNQKIKHDGNPIMEWMLSGCVLIQDPNENIRVDKGKSHFNGKRIDGIIALIMALGGSLSLKTNRGKYFEPIDDIYI